MTVPTDLASSTNNNDNNGDSSSTTPAMSQDASAALSECLFGQYAFAVAGVGGGTGYAIYRKGPKNGLAIMVLAGAAGTLADFGYGWTTACRPQVRAWYDQKQRLLQAAEEEKNRKERQAK